MGSGGGASGAVSYPTYIQTIHSSWLDNTGGTSPTLDIASAMNTAQGASPYASAVAFDPDTDIAALDAAVAVFKAAVDALAHTTDYSTAYATALALIGEDTSTLDSTALDTTTLDVATLDDSEISEDITAYSALLDDLLNDEALPKFRAGMHTIGAVQSSAFVIGEALLRAYKERDVAKYASEVRSKLQYQLYGINAEHARSFRNIEAQHKQSYRQITAQHSKTYREAQMNHKIQRGNLVRLAATHMLTQLVKQTDLDHEVAAMTIEARRIAIVAKKEENAEQLDYDEKDGVWDLETFAYGQNLLAGPTGGVHQNQRKPNKAVSALAGALSGAASGAAIGSSVGGPGYGTAIGAVLGAGLALAQ